MTRITTAALLVLALGACAESTEVSTTEQAVMGNHAAPTSRRPAAERRRLKAPYSKITVVLDVQPQTPTMVHVYFIDRAADFTYDHVVAKSSQLGGVITATVSLNQDLAIVGTATGPRPGGSGPRPGTEGLYALDLAGGFPDLVTQAADIANGYP
jgi:hypothetical protein